MKTLMLTLVVLLASLATGLAQIKVEIKEETKAMSKGSFNALVMDLPGTSAKDVNSAWKKFIKKYKGKTKFDRKMGEYFTDNAQIKDMSDNTVDLVAKIEDKGADAGTTLVIWFNLGASYLSSKDYADRYPAGEKMMSDFANTVSSKMIEEELKLQEKILKEKEKELKKLESDQKSFEKAIEDHKATIKKMEDNIAKAEGDIKTSEVDQKTKTTEISDQKKIVAEIKERLKSIK